MYCCYSNTIILKSIYPIYGAPVPDFLISVNYLKKLDIQVLQPVVRSYLPKDTPSSAILRLFHSIQRSCYSYSQASCFFFDIAIRFGSFRVGMRGSLRSSSFNEILIMRHRLGTCRPRCSSDGL